MNLCFLKAKNNAIINLFEYKWFCLYTNRRTGFREFGWVFVEVRQFPVKRRNASTLLQIIINNVKADITIFSDGGKACGACVPPDAFFFLLFNSSF